MKNRNRWDRLLLWASAAIALILAALMIFSPQIIARIFDPLGGGTDLRRDGQMGRAAFVRLGPYGPSIAQIRL